MRSNARAFGYSLSEGVERAISDRGETAMQLTKPQPFQTRREVERYFSGATIKCLLCGLAFQRLSPHLAKVHDVAADEYRQWFGLPWTRGLTSATSHTATKWTRKRHQQARERVRKSRFFKYGPRAKRRELAPFLKAEALMHLGIDPDAYGEKFEHRVRTLFDKGRSDREIARALRVGASTVNRRTKHWRASKSKKRKR